MAQTARKKQKPNKDAKPAKGSQPSPYGWASLAGLLVFALYALTLAPTTAFWDTSEYIATAHILGIPHPPGNPLFVVLGRAWEILLAPLGLSVAVKINLFSAFMSALAHGLWFLVVHRILSYFTREKRFPVVGAFVAVLISATAFTVWNQSNVNEKVYTVSLMTIALLSWLAFLWRDHLGEGKDDNLLILMVFILALSVGNHLMAFLAAPALVLFIFLVHKESLLNWRLYGAGAVVVLLGLSIHLFLPIRAGLDPVINEADPTCPSLGSAVSSVVTWGQTGCQELSEALSRQQYDKPPLIPRQANIFSQYANYLQYFDWQWARGVMGTDTVFAAGRMIFTMLFGALGIFGAAEHYKRDRKSWWYVTVLFATLSVALVFYLNFRHGFSLEGPGGRENHEVRERDYFFIVSFSIWGLWAGVGLAALWRTLAEEVRLGWAKASPILAIGFLPLFLNWGWASRADDYSARDWAYNLLQSVEPYGVIVTNGDNDTFPLWYLQEVEGIRRDVTVAVVSYLNTAWYAKQIRNLTRPCPDGVDPLETPTRIVCQRPYDPSNTDVVYTHDPSTVPEGKTAVVLDEPIRKPTTSILGLEDATIERVGGEGGFVPLRESRTVQLGNVQATLQGQRVLLPWQQFALAILDRAIGERAIYFASTTSAYEDLGLQGYLYRQGLAYRLHNGNLEENLPPGVRTMSRSPLTPVIGNYMDVDRTERLAEEIFIHRGGLPDEWDFWPDRSTMGIPNYYAWVHYGLAQDAAEAGDSTDFQHHQDRGRIWAGLGN